MIRSTIRHASAILGVALAIGSSFMLGMSAGPWMPLWLVLAASVGGIAMTPGAIALGNAVTGWIDFILESRDGTGSIEHPSPRHLSD